MHVNRLHEYVEKEGLILQTYQFGFICCTDL